MALGDSRSTQAGNSTPLRRPAIPRVRKPAHRRQRAPHSLRVHTEAKAVTRRCREVRRAAVQARGAGDAHPAGHRPQPPPQQQVECGTREPHAFVGNARTRSHSTGPGCTPRSRTPCPRGRQHSSPRSQTVASWTRPGSRRSLGHTATRNNLRCPRRRSSLRVCVASASARG